MYSHKRKYDEIGTANVIDNRNIKPENSFITNIKNCNTDEEIIYRIAIEQRSNFTREELLSIVMTIKRNNKRDLPPIEMSNYLI
jgi:hypothetical protein